jgi:hypothetical protein
MTCPFAHLDGAYVLGSLSPAERQEFERHLASCEECARGIREVAGLPGLLSRVDRAVLEYDETEPVPATLLPSLVREVRRRRRRTVLAVAGAAAAAAVLAVGVPVLVSGDDSGRVVGGAPPSGSPSGSPSATGATGAAVEPVGMTTVGGAPVRGTIALESVAWGTRLDLTCSYVTPRPGSDHAYGSGSHGSSGPTKYEMFVRTDDGTVDMVGTWHAPDGATMRVTAATAATRDEIASVVVRTAEGQPVLRLRG